MGVLVKSFSELTPELQVSASGKGGMLVRKFQNGYPVPEGSSCYSYSSERTW